MQALLFEFVISIVHFVYLGGGGGGGGGVAHMGQ